MHKKVSYSRELIFLPSIETAFPETGNNDQPCEKLQSRQRVVCRLPGIEHLGDGDWIQSVPLGDAIGDLTDPRLRGM